MIFINLPSMLSSSSADLSSDERLLYESVSYEDRLDIDDDNLLSRSKRLGVGGNVLIELDLAYGMQRNYVIDYSITDNRRCLSSRHI